MTTESTQIPGNPAAPLLCPIDDTGLIEVAGSDAEAFLNAQFSCDMDAVPPPRATLAGWHDARGRVLALLWALWTGERWLLLVRGGDTNALVRRLAMFVLRADVRLRDAAPAWQAAALAGGIDEWSATPFAMPGTRPGDVAEAHGAFAIRAGPRLAYLAAPRGAFEAVRAKFSAGPAEAATIEEIRLGLVNLIPDLSARYTAHMLNLDRLGALAFDKGCYPGQEIIARTQNLGAAKRRVFRFSGALRHVPEVASPLLDAGGNRAGEVVRAAAAATGVELLAVVSVDTASSGLVCAAAPDIPLTLKGLPGEPAPR